jgi:hypothetical protein
MGVMASVTRKGDGDVSVTYMSMLRWIIIKHVGQYHGNGSVEVN